MGASKIKSRRVVLSGDMPAIEMWNANAYARATDTPSGFHIEMLLYPGKREDHAETEAEAMRKMRAFLKSRE